MKHTLKSALIAATTFVVPASVQAADFLSIGSCPVGCTAYTWSAGIADVINKNVEGVEATAEETKGYVANIALMQGGELEASMATSLSAYEAWAGTGNYEGTEPGKIMAWMSIAPVAMHIITVEGSGVSGIDTCDARSMCYYVDSETSAGICVGFCQGSQNAPTCDDGFIYTIVNDGVLTLCRP